MLTSIVLVIICCSCFLKLVKFCCKEIKTCCMRRRFGGAARRHPNRPQNDAEERAEIERELANIGNRRPHCRNSKKDTDELLSKLYRVKFNDNFKANDDFQLKECVICMEEFVENVELYQIPTCLHYFHPDCGAKWFLSKN